VEKGDEVITSPITFVSTSNSAVYLGAKPVFVDIDLNTYCIDTDRIEDAITPQTKVIAPVDLAGYPVDLREIRKNAAEHDLIIIEDAAHALGAKRYGLKVGLEADMTMFSFHPVKHITTGEGGIIVTDNPEFYEKLRLFRSHGITKDPRVLTKNDGPWYYEMQSLGYNYRITDIQCALGISQLKKLDSYVQRRNEIAKMYDDTFKDNPDIITPPVPLWADSLHGYHIYPVLINGYDRKSLYLKLRKKGIFTQVHYIPVHLQPYYRENFAYSDGDFPLAEEYYRKELTIPMYPKMANEDVKRVIDSINAILGGV
ncbi:MAG: DegT/DnrJ/EryC1/StrS family aminotransferase, partial [Methanogenium sp.]|nr:DegT/DnrJ/EryC1/StrS family aminotransferase [Methanogenium sp.]